MIKHFSIQPNEESLNIFLDSHQPEEIGYPRIDLIEENGKSELRYRIVPPHNYSKDYLTIETINGETEVAFYLDVDFTGITNISYSLDEGETWITVTNSSTNSITRINLDKPNDKILFKGIRGEGNYSISNSDEPLGVQFPFINTGGGNCKVYGNIMSLQEEDDFVNCTELNSTSEFEYLFSPLNNSYGNNTIVDASNLVLPATTLATSCYSGMFEGCTPLTTAPALPATTLANSCYSSMFQNCTSLTTAPELPATTLITNCYYQMFYGCTSLTTAPMLPATTLAISCYQCMFYGCKSLTTTPELPVTILANSCYSDMFYGCTSLTTAPELPATTLANSCYSSMFYGCTSLTTAPDLPVTTLITHCYSYMFKGCTSLTTAPELPATTLAEWCYSNMFEGCTSLTTAPELPATILANSCYQQMFYKCTNLNYIKAMFTTVPSTNYTYEWVKNVASTGTFVKNSSASWNVTGTNGIPSGWTVQTA